MLVSNAAGPHQNNNFLISGHASSYGEVLRKGLRMSLLPLNALLEPSRDEKRVEGGVGWGGVRWCLRKHINE